MVKHMVDAYVRRDANAKNKFDSLAGQEEALVLPEGIIMSSKAFKNSVPQTQYTLQELGIDMAASPYVEALTVDETVVDTTVNPVEVHHHAEEKFVNIKPSFPTGLMSINNMVKEYWGLLVLVGVAAVGGYFIGRR
jgi:hypothetical protein